MGQSLLQTWTTATVAPVARFHCHPLCLLWLKTVLCYKPQMQNCSGGRFGAKSDPVIHNWWSKQVPTWNCSQNKVWTLSSCPYLIQSSSPVKISGDQKGKIGTNVPVVIKVDIMWCWSIIISCSQQHLQAMNDETLSLATGNFGDAEAAWDTWTLHFYIALTKVIICCTIFTDDTTAFTQENLTWIWRAYMYVYRRSCRDCVVYSQIFEDDGLRLVLSHGLHFPSPPPKLKSIHNKVVLVSGGGVFHSFFYLLICLPFITSSPQPEINWEISSVFFRCLQIQHFFGRTKKRFHLFIQ